MEVERKSVGASETGKRDGQKQQHTAREQNKSVHETLLMLNKTFYFLLRFSSMQNRLEVNLEHQHVSIGKRRQQVWLMNLNLLQKSMSERFAPTCRILLHRLLYLSTCIFCGEKNEDFIRDGLEQHYWSACPMLRRCQECNQVRSPNVCLLFFNQSCLFQVVEVAIYVEHLLRECENKGKYQQCPRCSEAIGNDFDIHIKLKECHETKPNTSR